MKKPTSRRFQSRNISTLSLNACQGHKNPFLHNHVCGSDNGTKLGLWPREITLILFSLVWPWCWNSHWCEWSERDPHGNTPPPPSSSSAVEMTPPSCTSYTPVSWKRQSQFLFVLINNNNNKGICKAQNLVHRDYSKCMCFHVKTWWLNITFCSGSMVEHNILFRKCGWR